MLNNVVIIIMAILVVIGVVFFCIAKYFYKKYKTTNTEVERLRNRLSALQEDYKSLEYAYKKKQELYNETAAKLNEINNGTADDAILRLQNRNNRKKNNGSS